jgi:hypothetical protein
MTLRSAGCILAFAAGFTAYGAVVPGGAKIEGDVKQVRPAGQAGERALLDVVVNDLLLTAR